MIKWISSLIWGRSLRSALDNSKNIKVHGVRFKIRKLNTLDFLAGSKVLQQSFQTYEDRKAASNDAKKDIDVLKKKLEDHYRDVFMAAVVSPVLTRKKEDGSESIFVDEILDSSDMSEALYLAIYLHTYGKKKVLSALNTPSL